MVVLPCVATGIVWWQSLPGRGMVPPWHDVLVSILHQDHLQRAWLEGSNWRTGPVAWPLADSVTQSDWAGLSALMGLPLHLLGVDAIPMAATIGVLGLFLSALATGLVARTLLGPGLHVGVASILGGMHPLAVAHAPYPNLVHAELSLLGALALGWGLHHRQPAPAALGALMLGGGTWAGFYLGSHAALMAVVLVLAATLARRPDRRTLAAVGLAFSAGVASLLPVFITFGRFSQRHGVTSQAGAVRQEVWDPSTGAIFAQGRTPAAVDAVQAARSASDTLAMGRQGVWLLALGLGLVGLYRLMRRARDSRWAWAAIAGVALSAAVLALGPELWWRGQPTGLPLPGAILAALPGTSGLRAPVRWLRLSFTALALLTAAGVATSSSRMRRPLAVLCWIGGLVLLRPMPAISVAELTPPRIYGQLQSLPAGAVVDLVEGRRTCPHNITHRLAAALDHRRPLMGGLYSRRIDSLVQLNRRMLGWPSADTIELFETLGVVAVIEHSTEYPAPPGLSCTEAALHRICTLSPRSLPPVDALEPVEDGPVDALWWTDAPPPRGAIHVTCGEDDWVLHWRTWQTISRLRQGTTGAAFEVVLPERCAGVPVVRGAAAGSIGLRRERAD